MDPLVQAVDVTRCSPSTCRVIRRQTTINVSKA